MGMATLETDCSYTCQIAENCGGQTSVNLYRIEPTLQVNKPFIKLSNKKFNRFFHHGKKFFFRLLFIY